MKLEKHFHCTIEREVEEGVRAWASRLKERDRRAARGPSGAGVNRAYELDELLNR